jgi:hypothetical protein
MANSVTVPVRVIRPILFASVSVNQRFPSGPLVICNIPTFDGIGYCANKRPVNDTFMIANGLLSPNQRFPSGPVVTALTDAPGAKGAKCVIVPLGVICPICVPAAYHRLPSGPSVISVGPFASANSVSCPDVVSRPILLVSVNQRLPSGPETIDCGALFGESANAVIGGGGGVDPGDAVEVLPLDPGRAEDVAPPPPPPHAGTAAISNSSAARGRIDRERTRLRPSDGASSRIPPR